MLRGNLGVDVAGQLAQMGFNRAARGIGIALASYDGTVHWGFNSDPEIVPDADAFVEQIKASYARVAKLSPEATRKPAAAKRKRSAARRPKRDDSSAATATT